MHPVCPRVPKDGEGPSGRANYRRRMVTIFTAAGRRQSTVVIAALAAAVAVSIAHFNPGPATAAAAIITCPPPNPRLASATQPSDC